jgi:hypothetical protein
MLIGLIIFAMAVLALAALAERFGVDTRDSDDWMVHGPLSGR